MTKEQLTSDITANIADRKKIAKRNFNITEILVLASILSSFLSATLAVNDHIDKHLIAILGGLSGIVTVIVKKFMYVRKSIWNEIYLADLQRLLNELEFAEPITVSERYNALQEKKEGEWATNKFEY